MALWIPVLSVAFLHLLFPFLFIVLAEVIPQRSISRALNKLKFQIMNTLLLGVFFPLFVLGGTAVFPLHQTTILTNCILSMQVLLFATPFASVLANYVRGIDLVVGHPALLNAAASFLGAIFGQIYWYFIAIPTSISISATFPAVAFGLVAAFGLTSLATSDSAEIDLDKAD